MSAARLSSSSRAIGSEALALVMRSRRVSAGIEVIDLPVVGMHNSIR